MDIFSFVQLFGGLAFFLYGMKLLSDSLKKTAGGRLEKLLRKATDNPFKGLAIGAIITIAISALIVKMIFSWDIVQTGFRALINRMTV